MRPSGKKRMPRKSRRRLSENGEAVGRAARRQTGRRRIGRLAACVDRLKQSDFRSEETNVCRLETSTAVVQPDANDFT
jgi:hypothetical protein